MNNLIELFKNSNYEFFFLVVDNFLDIKINHLLPNFHQIFAYESIDISPHDFCLERQGESIPEKNSGRLLSHPQVIEYITNTSGNKQAVIIPFKPSSKIEHLCQKHNWINAAVKSSTNRLLEDKIKFVDICKENDLPLIPYTICQFNRQNFDQAITQFGTNLVIQTHFGWAGNSTFFASYWKDIQDKIEEGTTVKISPLLDGYSLLNNCCLSSSGFIQSPPALQYTGLSGLTTNMFSTVGRQWPSCAPLEVIQKIKDLTDKFSEILKNCNYLGFFGLDFFVDQNQNVYLLECNPRLTASFAFYTQIELNANITPLFLFHLLQFVNLDYQIDIAHEQSRFYNSQIIGSEITKKNSSSQTILKYNAFESFSSDCDPIIIPSEIINKLQ